MSRQTSVHDLERLVQSFHSLIAVETVEEERIRSMPNLCSVVTLGQIAHLSTVRALGGRPRQHPFGHGATSLIGEYAVTASYHCSRYNTNTGVLTPAMFEAIFASVRAALG